MKKIYFFARDEPEAYQDDIVVLADGLQQLGHQVYGSCNYWKKSPDEDRCLLRHDPNVSPESCDVIAVSYIRSRWIRSDYTIDEQPLPKILNTPDRTFKTAYLDLDDGYLTQSWKPAYRNFDHVFRAKYNVRCFHHDNQHPWVLGINHRMLDCLPERPLPWEKRKQEILINFNASHPYVHGARARMGPPFLRAINALFRVNDTKDDLSQPPKTAYHELMWRQTQKRHSTEYYDRLKHAQAVVAFCGDLIPSRPFFPPYMVGGGRAKWLRRLYEAGDRFLPGRPRLIQWDSWRFWEALAAGCLVFNIDLDYYGVQLPVMPENGRHYIGLREDDMDQTISELSRNPDRCREIADAGHAWALQHYTPRALAQKFLNVVFS